jgi:hypothetical protein
MTQIKGKLKVKFDTVVVSDKFQKREFVIDTGGEYPQDILFQLQQNNCDKLDKFNVGDEVDVSYNPRGKSGGWTNPQGETKYFNTLECWKIESNF